MITMIMIMLVTMITMMMIIVMLIMISIVILLMILVVIMVPLFWSGFEIFIPSVTLNPTGALESLDEIEPHSQSKILNNSLRYTCNVDKYGPGMRNF
jgi:hypothetical protein